jgi:hypothetical protein
MQQAKLFSFVTSGSNLVAVIPYSLLGFEPEAVWNPSPSRAHSTGPYPVPQSISIGIRGNSLTSARFSPAPMAVIVEGGGRRCFVGIAADTGWHRWNEVRFEVTAQGVQITVDLEHRTAPATIVEHIRGLLLENAGDATRYELLSEGLRLQYPLSTRTLQTPEWWLQPIYCGWGDQVAFALHHEGCGPERRANAYCIQGLYERWIQRAEEAGVPLGTIIIDAGWSLSGVWEVDLTRWPDLEGFIRRQHEAGRKVLLWIATWLWDGLPEELCILADGKRLVADPTHPEYQRKLTDWVTELVSPHGMDADGFKIDQLAYCPRIFPARFGPRFGFTYDAGEPINAVRMYRDNWGIELLHEYQKVIYEAAKTAKPDCLVTSSTVHPYFHDTFDMVRLHDTGSPVPQDVIGAMKLRSDLARATLPGHPVDTDDWILGNYEAWLDYTSRSWEIGVPCLFYTERFVASKSKEPATVPIPDLDAIASAWNKAGFKLPVVTPETVQNPSHARSNR